MNWFTRIGAIFFLCLFSAQTFATSFDFAEDVTQLNSVSKRQQLLHLQSSNQQIICQEVLEFSIEKSDYNYSTPKVYLNKILTANAVVIEDTNKLSKSKKSFAYVKTFLFDSVQIIFPFHNFW